MLNRVFIAVITITAIWWPLRSFGIGLGLGDASVESTLSSPLRVNIPLRGMQGISLDPEKFSIEISDASRPNMQYRLERIDGDNATIVLYTRKMVTDPLVHFSLKVKWDRSAIARSYDVFLDPPSYQFSSPERTVAQEPVELASAETSAAIADEVSEPVLQPIAASSSSPTTEVVSEPEAGESEAADIEIAAVMSEQRGEYGPTADGDSAWRVARAVSTGKEGLTIYMWMYGIWKANPQAFLGSNMHRLKMNEMLSIPLESEIAEISREGAWLVAGRQMAMLKSRAGSPEPANDDVAPTSTVAELSAEIDDAVSSVDASSIDTPAESTPGNVQGSGGAAIAASTVVLVENVEGTEVSTDRQEVEASTVTGSFSSGTAVSKNTAVLENGYVILDSIENTHATSRAGETFEESGSTAEISQAAASGEIEARAPAAGALESRNALVASLPIIGSGAPLAFIGRAWQRADAFISNSPSWAAMAFGGWIAIVLSMLMQEFRYRRRAASAAVQRSSAPAPSAMQAPAQDPKHVTRSEADEALQVREDIDLDSEMEKADEQANPPVEAESSESPVAVEPKQIPAERGPDGRASDRRQAIMPVQPGKIDFGADEILQKANAFIANGNSGEAVKLLELTLKLQPNRSNLVLRLLEIYHELNDAGAFERLIQRSRTALEVMPTREKFDLQVMYSRLCPDLPPLDLPPSTDSNETTDLDESDYQLLGADEAPDEIGNETGLPVADKAANLEDSVDEEGFVDTQVMIFNNGVVLDENSRAASGMVGEAVDLDVTLREVDVYLAYGLYGNAEELLHKVKAIYPGRADLMARLLDSYYATGNVVDFEDEAEVLRSMGDDAQPYWEKVVIMGYELAPHNEMFAEGKDKSLGAFELETATPELPDFDLGAIEGPGGISATDPDLQADDADAESNEIVRDGDDIDLDLNEAEMALVSDEIDMNDDEISLDSNEIALDEDSGLDVDEVALGELAIDADDADLGDLDIAAALEEANTSLGVEAEAGRKGARPEELSETAAHNGDEVVVLEIDDDEEAMKFTIPEEAEARQSGSSVPVDGAGQAALDISARQDNEALTLVDSRILYFPDSIRDKVKPEQFEAFASEVRMGLQAIGDQMQNLTERQYRQERETQELHTSIAALSDDSPASAQGKSRKSRRS